MKNDLPPVRSYRQTARAQSASATGERILDAFMARLREGWFEEIRLDDVAADSGVTVQTIIRRFGGKEGLLDGCYQRLPADMVEARKLPVGDVPAAIEAIIREYALHGDFVMRMLAQEDRYASIRVITDHGRADHRLWVGQVFAPWLSRLEAEERDNAHDRLVIALDVYVWKLVRVDMKRPVAALRETMLALCAAALGTDPETLQNRLIPEKADV
jgi:AcrR family transcriptional regulator